MKIGGVQPKFTAEISPDRQRFEPASGGRFIVKPQHPERSSLPENEHLSMCLARRVDDPPNSREQHDFCQLLDLPSECKYSKPAASCAEVIQKFSSNATVDGMKLFRRLVFSYWIGNGDLHLKNLSLIRREQGLRLSPAYDLSCSWIFLDKKFALPVDGLQKNIQRVNWLTFAREVGLDSIEAANIIDDIVAYCDDAIAMVQRSPLPAGHQGAFMRCLRKRTRALS